MTDLASICFLDTSAGGFVNSRVRLIFYVTRFFVEFLFFIFNFVFQFLERND